MKKTNIFDLHQELGGKIVEFAGWQLPIKYNSAVEEHHAVRNNFGIFDVSHMGEILITGNEATKFLELVCCSNINIIKENNAQYSAILNHKSGIIDDIIIYKYSNEKYLLCVNASNTDLVFEWLTLNNKLQVEIKNLSNDFSQIAIQGSKLRDILNFNLNYFEFKEDKINNIDCIIARTGYTGDFGYEVFCPWECGTDLFKYFIELGATPCGLAARDSLRLEACYPLHGHELSQDISVLDSGLSWVLRKDRTFIGGDFLINYIQENKLIAFEVKSPGIVREKTKLFFNELEVGEVTSGTLTPTINKAIGMAIVRNEFAQVGKRLGAEVRGKLLEIEVVKKPFYKNI